MGGGGVGLVGVRLDVNEELKFLGKFEKNGGGGVVGGRVIGGMVRVDVNEFKFLGKFKKQNGGGGRVAFGGGSGFVGGQGGCERRIEVFVKIKKKLKGGGSGQVGGGGGLGWWGSGWI